MTEQLSYLCKVSESGELVGLARKKLLAEVRQLFSGKSIEILIHRKRKHRSVQQNRYYWLIVTMLSEDSGFTKSEMHEVLKQKFLRTEKVHENTGAIYEYTKSTTELTTIEYEEYLESVRRFAAEDFHIELPLPNEQLELTT